jgi:Gram-negative bacterial TonB protein C-terminal
MRKIIILIFISISFLTLKTYSQNNAADTSGVFTGTPDSLPHFINYPQGWYKFLEINLESQVPADNGAKPGRYQPIISFIVSEDGSLSDIQIKKDGKYKTGQEALRVMKLSPPWQPAMYQGHPVKYRFEQKITFEVTDN